MPAAIKHTKTTSSRSALLILIVANFSSRSSRYNLEKENQRLRKAVSDLTLDALILKEVVEGKY